MNFDGLNPVQLDAVTHGLNVPVLVVAGAGSGKTRVLTYRIAHLIENEGVVPEQILAITFTNKAANEMKERLAGLLGDALSNRLMWVRTFHSACVRILRAEHLRIGYPRDFTIYDESDTWRLISDILRDFDYDTTTYPPKSILREISSAKNNMVTVDKYQPENGDPKLRIVGEIWSEYERRMQIYAAMDFDDLLLKAHHLFETSAAALNKYSDKFQHVLVDEYQDSNKVQNELVQMLGNEHRNVFAVGDSDQAIYGFRGADIYNILNFQSAFPDAEMILLEQNYRSSMNILDAANSIIRNNEERQPKNLWTDNPNGERIICYQAGTEYDEAEWVQQTIVELNKHRNIKWNDIAVLYRTNRQSFPIEETLRRNNIPYEIIGGTPFYNRKEIKDIIAYLKASITPTDEVNLKRALNSPRRGVGYSTVNKLRNYADEYGCNLIDVLRITNENVITKDWVDTHGYNMVDSLKLSNEVGVPKRAAEGIKSFLNILDALSAPEPNQLGPAEAINYVLETSGYWKEQERQIDQKTGEEKIREQSRLDNLAQLVDTAMDYDTISNFLEHVSLTQSTDTAADVNKNRVSLMTIHSAKGLEFPIIFLVGLEENILPHIFSFYGDTVEEERRLAYVAVTRAEKQLYLSYAATRTNYGEKTVVYPSRFLQEIPEELIDHRRSKLV